MNELLFWVYMVNAVLLIIHEIESAYWQEWELFRLPGELTGFLLLHFPLLFVILIGIVEVYKASGAGYLISIIVALGGIFAFSIHTYFLQKGKRGFDLKISKIILFSILIVSLVQLGLSMNLFFK